MQKLARDFYDRDTTCVAQDLLGKYLVRVVNGKKMIGKIVEVEAYIGPHDLACHAAKGLTKRTQVMFGPPGHAYVYLIYGIYHCLNFVTEKEGYAAAVLVRALQPIENIETKTQGPGLLCKAMQIDLQLNGYDLTSDNFYVATLGSDALQIVKRPRIGIDYAKHWRRRLLRFYIKNNPYVSKK